MSLFKKNILKQYNILGYEGNVLLLHCSKNDFVKAPFDGKLDEDGTLSCANKHLVISNVKFDTFGKVKAGDIIGAPKCKNNKAYIGLVMYDKGSVDNIIKYLERKDVDEQPKKKTRKPKAEDIIDKVMDECIDKKFVHEEDGTCKLELSLNKDKAEAIIEDVK